MVKSYIGGYKWLKFTKAIDIVIKVYIGYDKCYETNYSNGVCLKWTQGVTN